MQHVKRHKSTGLIRAGYPHTISSGLFLLDSQDAELLGANLEILPVVGRDVAKPGFFCLGAVEDHFAV